MSSESELRRHLHQLTVLHELTTRIVSTLDPDEVITGVLDSLNDLLQYQTAAVYLVDLNVAIPVEGVHSVIPTNTLPRLRASRTLDEVPLPEDAGDESTVAKAMRERQTVGQTLETGALQLGVPLLAGGRALGTLDLRLRAMPGIDDVTVVELLAATAAAALQNAYLYRETQRLATIDPLTGLSNYRHFHELLGMEVQRARRMAYPVGFMMMDIDHFKLVNDRHGHPLGDQALQQVSEQLRTRLRRTDVVGRIGGEEFAAILPGDSLPEVAVVAEKLRRAVEDLPPLSGGMAEGSTKVTLSVGGTSLESDVVTAELLMSYADRALYQAKRNGRNQVRLTAP